jgi:DnaK suppressor protein
MAKTKGPLTEAELLKMSEKDYMNAAQLAFFKTRLTAMRDEILEKAAETVEHMREIEAVADPADRATVEEEHTLELRTRDRERKLLRKIEESIARIDDGSYGWCAETGEPIGVPRLLARPTATLSIEAQERRERLQKQYGDG